MRPGSDSTSVSYFAVVAILSRYYVGYEVELCCIKSQSMAQVLTSNTLSLVSSSRKEWLLKVQPTCPPSQGNLITVFTCKQ